MGNRSSEVEVDKEDVASLLVSRVARVVVVVVASKYIYIIVYILFHKVHKDKDPQEPCCLLV